MSTADSSSPQNASGNQVLFWGCFVALITTSFAFFTRIYLCNVRFGTDFGIQDDAVIGSLIGAGIWPFAISIILFSLVIDRIGYRVAMFFSFASYAIYLVLACLAYASIQGVEGEALVAAQKKGLDLLYWGSVILALGNGTVEAFINPVVATVFSREKTKWLNILHAGWPGGLVIAGIITIAMADTAATGDWRLVLGVIAIPAIIYLVMLVGAKFPASERSSAGVSYREMLGEFGAFGALVGFGLIFLQLAEVFKDPSADADNTMIFVGAGIAALVVAGIFGAYTKSPGRGIMAFLIIIMMPLATTEIGTDAWISGLMEEPMKVAGYNAGWVLVYTSAIMMVLRFFAGPIVHSLSPIGLLIISAILAIAGLYSLSLTGSAGLLAIFAAATLYGFGKTFFWPTMLGVTAEQCPKGGALTLNAISGIGMIAVGVLGTPFIGMIQESTASAELTRTDPEIAAEVVEEKSLFAVLKYDSIVEGAAAESAAPDPAPAGDDATGDDTEATGTEATAAAASDVELPEGAGPIANARKFGQFAALAKMAFFPAFMLACYIALHFYFKSKGGYKAIHLDAGIDDSHPAHGAAAAGELVDDHVTADEAIADGAGGATR